MKSTRLVLLACSLFLVGLAAWISTASAEPGEFSTTVAQAVPESLVAARTMAPAVQAPRRISVESGHRALVPATTTRPVALSAFEDPTSLFSLFATRRDTFPPQYEATHEQFEQDFLWVMSPERAKDRYELENFVPEEFWEQWPDERAQLDAVFDDSLSEEQQLAASEAFVRERMGTIDVDALWADPELREAYTRSQEVGAIQYWALLFAGREQERRRESLPHVSLAEELRPFTPWVDRNFRDPQSFYEVLDAFSTAAILDADSDTLSTQVDPWSGGSKAELLALLQLEVDHLDARAWQRADAIVGDPFRFSFLFELNRVMQ